MKKTHIILLLVFGSLFTSIYFSCKKPAASAVMPSGANLRDKPLTQPLQPCNISATEADVSAALVTHNEIMAIICNEGVADASKEGLINFVLDYAESHGYTFNRPGVQSQLTDFANKYGALDLTGQLYQLYNDQYITTAQRDVLLQLDVLMSNSVVTDLGAFNSIITQFEQNNITNNTSLTECEKRLLHYFVMSCSSSASIYFSLDSERADDMAARFNKRRCGRCIKDNFWVIIGADAIGAIGGLIACLWAPPSCVTLIAVFSSFSSGFMLMNRCSDCRP